MTRKYTSAVKRQRQWPFVKLSFVFKHFEEGYFVTEGVGCHDACVPAQECLKPDAVPMIFARSIDHQDTSSS